MSGEYVRGFDEIRKPAAPSDGDGGDGSVYPFTPKYQYEMKNNPLCGITLPAWLTILRRRWRQIDWVAYGPRLAFITYMACLNTFLSAIEFVLNGRAVRAAEARQEHAWQSERPVFVLGHPRTGTTLLHGMLALDKERFRYCDTFAAGFPNAFLWFEGIGKKLLAGVIDETRPMDNMKLSFDLPQEEELATNVLSAGASPYMPLFFMRNAADFEPLYSFDDASAEDKAAWLGAFRRVVAKLEVQEGRRRPGRAPRRLLLKSPVHTARARLLLQLFPRAEFVYVHRHPLEVFASAAHMVDEAYWYTFLAKPTAEQMQEFILSQYEILWDAYERDRKELLEPQGRIYEVRFEDLTTAPVETLRGVYEHFGWEGFDEGVKPAIEAECRELKGYKKNRLRTLPPALEEIVRGRWGPSFERLGYE